MRYPDYPAWTCVDTALGELLIVTTHKGVRRSHFAAPDAELGRLGAAEHSSFLDAAARALGRQPQPAGEELKPLVDQVIQWFDGERQNFDVTLDLSGIEGFRLALYRVIQEVPFGETVSYGEAAALAGSPLAARAAGTACRDVPISLFLPVHRVVRADGTTGESPNSPCHRRNLLWHEQAVLGRGTSPWN